MMTKRSEGSILHSKLPVSLYIPPSYFSIYPRYNYGPAAPCIGKWKDVYI